MAVDYRFVNRFTHGDAYPMREIGDIIQRMGRAKVECWRNVLCLLGYWLGMLKNAVSV